MKKTYTTPTVVRNGDFVRETRNSETSFLKPDWPYPEHGDQYAKVPPVEET